MDYFGAEDIDDLIAATGGLPVSLTVSGQQHDTLGLVDIADEELIRDVQVGAVFTGKVTSVVVKTGTLPGVAEGSSITVDGTAMLVVAARQIDDGALTRLFCRET